MCTSPLTITRNIAGQIYSDLVPCGRCSECLKKRQSQYVCRCIEEARKLGRVWFITLTYSEQNCPLKSVDNIKLRSLRREDVKKWKREVRRAYLKKYGVPFPKFSFLICGEYGNRSTKRPHYHGFLCGLDLKYAQILEDYWQTHYGFALFKPISLLPSLGKDDISCVARYVAKYCSKPEGLRVPNDYVEKPRIQTSPNFGVPEDFERYCLYMRSGLPRNSQNFSLAQVSKINDRCKYTYNGVSYSLPLYLKRKIFYEKNSKGNYCASTLSRACSIALRNNSFEDLYRLRKELGTSFSEREVCEMAHTIAVGETDNLRSRCVVADKNLLSDMQKSKF